MQLPATLARLVIIAANGKKIGDEKFPRTIPLSLAEGLDVGMDTGSAVDFTDKLPFAFTGKIDQVTVELK